MNIVNPSSFTAGRRISFGEGQVALTTPTLTLGATTGTGGTFTAGPVFWVLTATDADGETIKSNQVTATLAATSKQVLTWVAVPNATGYKIYRGTATGVHNKRVVTLGVATTYTDLGNPGTSATPPTVGGTVGPVVVYNPGDTIPKATVKAIRNLSSLLSNRSIIPNVDPHHRRNLPATPTPTDASVGMRRSL
jgi:hypothetical protein